MKRIHHYISSQPRSLRAAALIFFLVTPGSMLVLPLLAWWMARRGTLSPNG